MKLETITYQQLSKTFNSKTIIDVQQKIIQNIINCLEKTDQTDTKRIICDIIYRDQLESRKMLMIG